MVVIAPIACWRRPALTGACFRSLENAARVANIDLRILPVVSSEDPDFMQQPSGYLTALAPNSPLGAKHNHGWAAAAAYDWDFIVIFGSDTIVAPDFFEYYDYSLEAQGWTDCYFIDKEHTTLHYWPGYNPKRRDESVGSGRMYSRACYERIGPEPWEPTLERNLDHSFTVRTGVCAPHKKLATYMVDVKSDIGLTELSRLVTKNLGDIPDVIRDQLPRQSPGPNQ